VAAELSALCHRRTHMQLLRAVAGTGLAVALAGATIVSCSSSHHTTTSGESTTTGTASTTTPKEASTTPPTTPGPTPKEAATALGQRMLARAVLPTGARPSTSAAPSVLRGPCELVPGKFVLAHRVWTVPDDSDAVYQWLQAHPPSGFQSTGTCSSVKDPGVVQSRTVIDGLLIDQENISEAELQFGIAKNGAGGTTVRADAVVGWTERRAGDEYVPAADRVVIVSVIRAFQPGKPVVRRVVVTDHAKVAQIERAFDALRVSPSPWVSGCYMLTSNAVSYRIAFASSPTAAPDVVATAAACSPLNVTVGGRPRPALSGNSGAFGLAVAHAIGQTTLNFQ